MLGFSIYQQNYSPEYIQLMTSNGFKDVFISLHVNEEVDDKHATIKYLTTLAQFQLNMIADVSPITFKFFSYEELKKYGISTLRIDYGFSIKEIYELSHEFELVLNASTLIDSEIEELKQLNFDFSKVTFMHNFYPKVETGLFIKKLKNLNEKYHTLGVKVLSFIPGDLKMRGPIYEGLPTIEEHRYLNPLISFLQLSKYCDKIFIADISIKENTLKLLKILNQGIVPIPIKNLSLDNKFLNIPLTIRVDSNHLVLRIEDSRFRLKTESTIEPYNTDSRKKGSITIDNKFAKRYSGEVMIARQNLESRESLNVVAYVEEEFLKLIDEIDNDKIMFIENIDIL